MLIPPEISSYLDLDLPLGDLDETKAPFDGVVVLRHDQATNRFSFCYASEALESLLGHGSLTSHERAVDEVFSPDDDSELLSSQLLTLLEGPSGTRINISQDLLGASGIAIPSLWTFSLLQLRLDVDGSNAAIVLGVFRDLSKSSAEKLVADSISVSNSLSMGRDLGTVCFEMCNATKKQLGDGYAVSLGIVGPSGTAVPIILAGKDAELIEGLLIEADNRCVSSRLISIDLLSLPTELSGPLSLDGTQALWMAPLVNQPEHSPEETGSGYLFDLGFQTTGELEKYGTLIVTSTDPNSAHPSEKQVEAISYAQQLLSVAVSHAYHLAIDTHRSSHDRLTSLPNRELVLDQLEATLAQCQDEQTTICALLVDIDHFGAVNHTLGEDAGDIILKQIAERLLASVRLGDQVGRISSDQYLMVCVSVGEDFDPDAVAQRVLSQISKPITLDTGQDTQVTASIGYTVVEDSNASPIEILGKAESALKTATSTGGRGSFAAFDSGQHQQASDRVRLESAIANGLKNKEFRVVYQPLVDIETSTMIGAEALLRWDRPGVGLVSPSDFIPVAEESGLITELGKWLIDRVCQDLATWEPAQSQKPLVTVNLSAKQLESDLLVPELISALRRNGLHPASLGFEITESMKIQNTDTAIDTLNKIKELDCHIAIDDFGIGHATMEYLRTFSMASALKIDRSFVAGLGTNQEDSAIVSASMALASSLGMQVVAEGVETAEQATELRSLGCKYGQGFGYSKPVTLTRALQLWRQRTLPISQSN